MTDEFGITKETEGKKRGRDDEWDASDDDEMMIKKSKVRSGEERRTARAKRQLNQYLTYFALASIATPLLVASLLARFAHHRR